MSIRITAQTASHNTECTYRSQREFHTDDLLRRLLDVTLASVALLLLLPVFVLVAVAIRLDSPGSVLFTQTRVGKDGTVFPFFKFRSMYADAEHRLDSLMTTNDRNGPVFKMRHDPRITRVGQWLRRWSLDETPQLLNVLRGEMSLVGPRPGLPREIALYTPEQRERLTVTPGMTGLWQVSGRADLSFERSMQLDLEYIKRRSFALNCEIILRTIPAVLTRRGAY